LGQRDERRRDGSQGDESPGDESEGDESQGDDSGRAFDPQNLLAAAQRRLARAGIDQPRREARLLLAHATGAASPWLAGDAPGGGALARFEAALARREAREPLALITGRQGFWTLDLSVSADTLIPRADSETLIESLLEHRPDRAPPLRLLDLGTGTGCLLLAALSEYPQGWGLGIDRSEAACRLAAGNARDNGLAARSAFCCSDWDAALGAGGAFDVVLSNPPYIAAGEIDALMPEVARFEPRSALDGGDDGLDAYRLLAARLPGLLRRGGLALLELGRGQQEAVRAAGEAAGLDWLGARHDLSGIPRAAAFGLA